jgi:repressor of nif and glnA expression
MARDMDLVRRILMEMEELVKEGKGQDLERILKEEGYSGREIHYHLKLLSQAGFIEAVSLSALDGYPAYLPRDITWEGYDFLEAIRDEGIYKRAKATALEKTGGVVLSVLKDLAIQLSRQAAGL